MKKLLFILLISITTYSQEKKNIAKVLIDYTTRQPIKNVTIYNHQDFTISNYEGKFRFSTHKDSINFRLLGYKSLFTSIKNIQKLDTIFLVPLNISLEEVVIKSSSIETNLKNIFNKFEKLTPNSKYTESFFLRTLLKRNNKIIVFQDIAGRAERPKLFTSLKEYKRKLKINILNMRKLASLSNSKYTEKFDFASFSKLFEEIAYIRITFKKYKLKKLTASNSQYLKITFNPIDSLSSNTSNGYYLIDTSNNSLKEVAIHSNPNYSKIPFNKTGKFKFRTIGRMVHIKFTYNPTHKKYYISNATFKGKLEVINQKKETIIYDVQYNLLITESFIPNKIKSNFSSNKNIFEAKTLYNEKFWETQNQLLLDKDLKIFIQQTKNLKNIKSEFKLIENF